MKISALKAFIESTLLFLKKKEMDYNIQLKNGHSLKHAAELKVPLLLMHGSDDMITSPEASREFTSKTEMAELIYIL